jgi:hypothetical protein
MESAALIGDTQFMVPRETCSITSGPLNVDGKCILGGRLMSSGLRGGSLPSMGYPSVGCGAYPVYIQTMVPYSNGTVAGSDYKVLSLLKNR